MLPQQHVAAWQRVSQQQDNDNSGPCTSGVRGRPTIRRSASSPAIFSRSPSTRRRSRVFGARGGVSRGVGPKTKPSGVLVWEDCATFVPQIRTFDATNVGVIPLFPYTGDDMAEIDYFLAYFDNKFMTHLVTETNRYTHSLIYASILQHCPYMVAKNYPDLT